MSKAANSTVRSAIDRYFSLLVLHGQSSNDRASRVAIEIAWSAARLFSHHLAKGDLWIAPRSTEVLFGRERPRAFRKPDADELAVIIAVVDETFEAAASNVESNPQLAINSPLSADLFADVRTRALQKAMGRLRKANQA